MKAPSSSLRTRWAAVGAAVAVTLGAAGVGGYNLVNAEVGTGNRPVFIPLAPCRLMDTRLGDSHVGPKSSPFGPGETVTVTAHGENGKCAEVSTIPSDAVGLSLNVTALGQTERTFLTVWSDGDDPGTSNLNPAPGQPPTPNAVNTPLSATGTFKIRNNAGNVNVIVDVNGYYANHNHDDRYYSRSEADALNDELRGQLGAAVTVGNGEGVGGSVCSGNGIEVKVKNALGEFVDARFSYIVPDYDYGQVRSGGSVRNTSGKLMSVEHPSPGSYCLVFGPGLPSQVQAESTVASVTADP